MIGAAQGIVKARGACRGDSQDFGCGRAPAQSSRRSRPLLLLERTMYGEGRTPFTSVSTIKLLGSLLDEARLQQALARVQATRDRIERGRLRSRGQRRRFHRDDSDFDVQIFIGTSSHVVH
jgi:hypothetical protein